VWQHRIRLVLIWLALALTPLAGGLIAVVLAPPTTVHDVGLDGLNLDIGLQLGRTSTEIDSALLGGLRTQSPTILGKPVGLDIRPSDLNLSLFDPRGKLDGASVGVLGHLFSDPQAQRAELHRITAQVIRYYATIFCVTTYLVICIEGLGYIYLRRRALRLAPVGGRPGRLLSQESRVVRVGAAVVSLLLIAPAAVLVSPLSNRDVATAGDVPLTGTFLSHWQLTGPFTQLIRQGINSIDSLSQSEAVFYNKVSHNRDQAYIEHYGSSGLPHDKDIIRIAILDDLQGTSGMARIVGEAAQNLHADAILNLGDLTATGTAQESYLSYLKSYTVEVLSHYAGDIPVYTSLGRHDTPTVVSYAKKVGFTVADGSPHKIAGLKTIGANSPYIVNFGDAARLKDPAVTTDSVAKALTTTACDNHPVIVYAHDKELLNGVIDSGCAPIVIGGHSYDGEPSKNITTDAGVVRKVILGSTGGHGAGDGIGGLTTPRNNAPFELLSIDKKTGEVRVDTTVVHPDSSVTVSSVSLDPLSGDQRDRLG